MGIDRAAGPGRAPVLPAALNQPTIGTDSALSRIANWHDEAHGPGGVGQAAHVGAAPRSGSRGGMSGPGRRGSYTDCMNVATVRVEVGIRELKNGLSKYIDRVRAGDEVIVTDRGRPVARLSAVDASVDRLAELVAAGIVRAPVSRTRHLPKRLIKSKAPVSDLVAEQRR